MSAELKPCPFCGCTPRVKYLERTGGIVCPESSPCHGSGLCFLFLPQNEASAIAAWNTRAELNKNTQTNEQAACDKVLAAVRAYLPPDGISRLEFISRVFEAVDNPKFNAGLKTAEPAEDYDETMMKLHAGWRQRLDRKGEEG